MTAPLHPANARLYRFRTIGPHELAACEAVGREMIADGRRDQSDKQAERQQRIADARKMDEEASHAA
jgi:hypothetical protein